MKKKFHIGAFIVFQLFVLISLSSANEYIFQDDFESYNAGDFPSSGSRELVYDGYGEDYQKVTNEHAHYGNQSFKLEGKSNWFACATKKLSSTPYIIYLEAYVKVIQPKPDQLDDETLSVSFFNKDGGTWGREYASICFGSNQEIKFLSQSEGDWKVFHSDKKWDPETWYKIKIRYDNKNKTGSAWIDDELIVRDFDLSGVNGSYNSIGLKALHWNSEHSRVCFDDIKVYTEPTDHFELIKDNFLSIGNRWDYNLKVTKSNNNTVDIDGKTTFECVEKKNVENYKTTLVRRTDQYEDEGVVRESENYWFITSEHLVEAGWKDGNESETVINNDPWEIVPVTIDGSYQYCKIGKGQYSGKSSDGYEWTGDSNQFATFIGVESITVPAGSFECVVVELSSFWADSMSAGNSIKKLWIKKEIGIIKGEFTDKQVQQDGTMLESSHTIELTKKKTADSEWYNTTLKEPTEDRIVGRFNDIAVDSKGTVHICYYDDYDGYIKYLKKEPQNSWSQEINIERIDIVALTAAANSSVLSMAIDSLDNVHVVFHNQNDNAISYATNKSGTWVIEEIETEEVKYDYLNDVHIAIDSSDGLHILYCDYRDAYYDRRLKYKSKSLDSWSSEAILDPDFTSQLRHVATDSQGNIHATLYRNWAPAMKMLEYGTNISGSWETELIEESGFNGAHSSIVMDSSDKMHIAYWDRENRSLKYTSNLTGTWDIQEIDTGTVGGHLSISIDLFDNIHISYSMGYGVEGIKYANNMSGNWHIEDIDLHGSIYKNSLAVDNLGYKHACYFNYSEKSFMYATTKNDVVECTYSISPASLSFDPGGGSQDVAIDATHSECSWSVTENLDWLSVSPASGTGDGSVTITVEENTGSSRSGIVIINGKEFEITQAQSINDPVIIGTIPDQIKYEDNPAWTIDLTPYESDKEDSGTDLDWSVSGVDNSIFSAEITDADEDILTITPAANASGTDTITLTLTDSGDLTDSQDILVTINASDCPIKWEPTTYTNSTTFYGIVTIYGQSASAGDKVGAFVNEECRAVGDIMINNGNTYVNLVINGEIQENVNFKILRASDCKVLEVNVNLQTNPGGTIGQPPDYYEITYPSDITQTIEHNSGWNLISRNVEPEDTSPASIFDPIMQNLIEAKDTQRSYNPDVPDFLNTLTTIEAGFGYWVKTDIDTNLEITGTYVDESIDIHLSEGWNLIGYPCQTEQPVTDAFADIMQDVIEVKSTDQSYNPAVPDFLNTLQDIKPGKGYWLKVSSDMIFSYPASSEPASASRNTYSLRGLVRTTLSEPIWQPVTYTNSTTAYGVVTIDGQPASAGDKVGAFAGDECRAVGTIAVNEDKAYVTLVINGEVKESINFKVYDSKQDKIFDVENTYMSDPGNTIGTPPDFLELSAVQDTDGDGILDVIENAGCTDPNDADTDNDGIPDGVEDFNKNGHLDQSYTDAAQTSWEEGFTYSEIGTLSAALTHITCSVVDNNIFLMGGENSSGTGLDTIHLFDSQTGQLTLLNTKLPYGMMNPLSAVASNNKIYIGPSHGPQYYNGWGQHKKIVEFDPNSESCIETNAGYSQNTWLPAMVSDNSGNIYAIGGWNGGPLDTIYKYNFETDSLQLVSNLSHSDGNECFGVLGTNGKIYIFAQYSFKRVEEFDPATNITKQVAVFPTGYEGIYAKAGWVENENIFLLMKKTGADELSLVKFQTDTAEFIDTGHVLPISIAAFGLVEYQESIYLFGGKDWVLNQKSDKIYKLNKKNPVSIETDPCNVDTDGDGIQDGTEKGYTLDQIESDTDLSVFQPDLNPETVTNPLLKDTDNDGLDDGTEDANHNGRLDSGETDPANPDGNPDIHVEPCPIDFGSVPVNTQAIKTIIIYNNGNEPLEITSINISGDNADQFSVNNVNIQVYPFTLTIPANDSYKLELACTPDSEGSKSAVVCIESNDPDEPAKCCDITGKIIPDADIIALWHLNGDGNDTSGNGNHLNIDDNLTEWKTSEYGQGVKMLGPGQFGSRAISSSGASLGYPGTGDFTVEAWIKFDILPKGNPSYIVGQSSPFISCSDPYHIQLEGDGRINFHIDQGGCTDPRANLYYDVSNLQGTWIHVAGVYIYKQQMMLFINGEMVASKYTTIVPEVRSSEKYPLTIGGVFEWTSKNVTIDEVMLSSKARYDPSVLKGDLNSDEKIDLSDTLLGLKVITNHQTIATYKADVNNDGRIGYAEILYPLQKLIQPLSLTGYWEIYHTETDTTEEEGPEYCQLIQSETNVSGHFLCGDESTDISGTMSENIINLTFADDGKPIVLDGTFNGDTASGTYSKNNGQTGTWRIQRTENTCSLNVNVATQNYDSKAYYLGINLYGIDPDTVSSVSVTGPNVNQTWHSHELHWVTSLTAQPVIGDVYSITVTYTDHSTETQTYTVNGINSDFAYIISPTDQGSVTTTTPTFQWQAAQNPTVYHIMVTSENGDYLWDKSLPSGVTSVTFNNDGEADGFLKIGDSYRIYIHSYNSDGNQATTQSTFTVTNDE